MRVKCSLCRRWLIIIIIIPRRQSRLVLLAPGNRAMQCRTLVCILHAWAAADFLSVPWQEQLGSYLSVSPWPTLNPMVSSLVIFLPLSWMNERRTSEQTEVPIADYSGRDTAAEDLLADRFLTVSPLSDDFVMYCISSLCIKWKSASSAIFLTLAAAGLFLTAGPIPLQHPDG